MNKKKYGKAVALGLILSVCAMHPDMTAEGAYEAVDGIDLSSFMIQDGYEKCSPSFTALKDYEKYDDSFYYARYKQDSNSYDLISYYDFHYNCVTLILSDSVNFDAAYEAYFTDLDFDVICDDGMIRIYDTADEGDNPISPVTVERKVNEAKALCKKIYGDGILEYAVYSTAKVYYDRCSVENAICCTFEGTADALSEIAGKYSDNHTIRASETEENAYTIEFHDIQTLNRLDEICNSFNSEDDIPSVYRGSDSDLIVRFAAIGEMDLLAAVQKEAACDVDGSGTVDISDAVLILQHYAESAASGAAAASETNMDVNGDGSITIDDATEVLGIYAQNAAGVTES